jgi:uncharacterized protein YeaO (DUF488 family)
VSELNKSEARPNIYLKRIYDPPGREHGARVLVDRLWSRSIRLEIAKPTPWLKEIAPSPELLEWFCHDPARVAQFSRRYRGELAANKDAVGRIKELLKLGEATLLNVAHDTAHNYVVVQADYLRDLSRRRIGTQKRADDD